jgi:lipopolysaccharide transport system permease protein
MPDPSGAAQSALRRTTVIRSTASVPFGRYLNPVTFVGHLWQHRSLIWQFTRREVEGRYRSSALGIVWSFVNPLALLLVYTFVFGVVFKQRWAGRTDDLTQFGLLLFAGMAAYGIFSDCVSRAPSLIVANPNYVKRVVFPLELLPPSVLGAALFHAAISLAVLLLVDLVLGGMPRWQWLMIPVLVLPAIMLSLGLLWFLSSLGVFIRDLGYATALVVQILFFLTPIFYPVELIPEPFRLVVRLNPLASVVTAVRAAIFPGLPTAWLDLGLAGLVGLMVMLFGYAWFMRTRRAFGDVI